MNFRYLHFAIVLLLLLPKFVSSQTFTSVDINTPIDSSSFPSNFIECNGKLFFTAADGVHGQELWISDGTKAGTQMVKDIWPGKRSSNIKNMIVYRAKLYFQASDSIHGSEMWVSDGTNAGTNMVLDIMAGSPSSFPAGFIVYSNVLLFSARDLAHGDEIWISDGTPSGTILAVDVRPGIFSSSPTGFTIFNNLVYFSAYDSAHGQELWVTDATGPGTSLVADINPGFSGSYPGSLLIDKNGMPVMNNKMYFDADDGVHGSELWSTDGTTLGTTMVADACPGPLGLAPGYFTGAFGVYNNKIYFSGQSATLGFELYSSDGTNSGTGFVKDINTGPNSSNPQYFTVFNNRLFFSASDASGFGYTNNLYVTDGTALDTLVQTNTCLATRTNFYTYSLTVFNNLLYMTAPDSANYEELFSTDGINPCPTLLMPAGAKSYAQIGNTILCPFNGGLAFAADYDSTGMELWFYNPTTSAINEIGAKTDINVYPNPFDDNITINGLETGSSYQITLTDLQGRQLEQHQIQANDNSTILKMPLLPGGIYLLQLNNKETIQTIKLVKQ
ncbi:MAG: hypothetical protein JWO06_2994 [Bacteroidota bacterium]|nr:hypothetical protein [Bacteroidota bacterium]